MGGKRRTVFQNAFIDRIVPAVLRIHRINIGVSAAKEHKHARHDIEIFAEVFTCEGTFVIADRFFAEQLHDRLAATLGAFGIVRQAGIAFLIREFRLRVERFRRTLDKMLQALGHGFARFVAPRTNRARKVGRASHDVAGFASMDLAHGNHEGLEG